MEAREPPIATLPRQARPDGEDGLGAAPHQLAHVFAGGSVPWNPMAGSWKAAAGRNGYARQAVLLERRLGWILWGALLALVLALSV